MPHLRAILLCLALFATAALRADGIVQNEDNTHYFVIGKVGSTRQDLTEHIDHYLHPGHQMREFFLNPGSWLFSFKGHHCEAVWEKMDFRADGSVWARGQELPPSLAHRFLVMKRLHEDGINPYHVWIEHLRKRGISPWVSWRPNDIHDPFTEGSPFHSDFWRDHPQWRNGVFPNRNDWQAAGMDYRQDEVRQHALDIFLELIDTFDADGYELDFMRFGQFFRHGLEIESQGIMLDFLRTIRRHLDEKAARLGRGRLKLGIRVAADPRDAYRLGFDVEAMAREGLVDMVTAATVFHTTWHDLPVREWKRICGPDVLFAACIESNKRSHWNFHQSGYRDVGDVTIGLAASYLWQGADRIYLFNTFWYPKDIMTLAGSLKTAAQAPMRRHPILYNDLRAVGEVIPAMLPQKYGQGYCRPYRINIGPAPQEGQRAYIVLAFRDGKCPDGDFAQIYVNSNPPLHRCADGPKLFFKEDLKAACAYFEIPAGQLHDGENILEVYSLAQSEWSLDWVEICIGK